MSFDLPGLGSHSMQRPLVTFLGVLTAYPQAVLEINVRNFNTIEPTLSERPESRLSVSLTVYLEEDRGHEDSWKIPTIWTDNVNLSRIFPFSVMSKLRAECLSDGVTIPWWAFLVNAQAIADALNRKIDISHQEGGNMEYAYYDIFGTYTPGLIGPLPFKNFVPADIGY